MTKIGWKIVRAHDLMSPYSGHSSQVQYKVGKSVTHLDGCGPLGVFTTRAHARAMKKKWPQYGKLAIYKCEYEKSALHGFWDKWGGKYDDMPPGTDFAESVTLLKKSWW